MNAKVEAMTARANRVRVQPGEGLRPSSKSLSRVGARDAGSWCACYQRAGESS